MYAEYDAAKIMENVQHENLSVSLTKYQDDQCNETDRPIVCKDAARYPLQSYP